MNQTAKNIAKVTAVGIALISIYKILSHKNKSPIQAVKETISAPIDIIKDAGDKVVGIVSQTPEKAKETASSVVDTTKDVSSEAVAAVQSPVKTTRKYIKKAKKSAKKVSKEILKEKAEHPSFSKKQIKQIVKDHKNKKRKK